MNGGEFKGPILRGRDIKRYSYEWANLYLLFIPWHFPLHEEKAIVGASGKAEREFEKHYPAMFNHLLSFKKELSARNEAEVNVRYEWYALQRWGANYSDDFSKPKIVWGNLALSAQFASAPSGMFVNAPSPMIVPFNGYLLAFLNSKVGDWYIRQLGVTRNGGYFEYKPMFVEQVPVPMLSAKEQSIFSKLAEKATGDNQREIDDRIFALLKLTDKEQTLLENQSLPE